MPYPDYKRICIFPLRFPLRFLANGNKTFVKIHKIRGQEIGQSKIFQYFSVERFLIYEDESLEGDGLIGRGGGKLAFS